MEGTCLTPKLWAETPKAPEKSEKYEKRVERKYISFRAYRRDDLVNFGRVAIEKKVSRTDLFLNDRVIPFKVPAQHYAYNAESISNSDSTTSTALDLDLLENYLN